MEHECSVEGCDAITGTEVKFPSGWIKFCPDCKDELETWLDDYGIILEER